MITHFAGEYRFLSNFWPAQIMWDFEEYPSVEHAYQAAKSVDRKYRDKILQTCQAGEAKRLGRTAKLREDWEEIKLGVMEDLVRQKFKRHKNLGEKLVETGDQELIEGNNWHDRFWGCELVDKKWVGENHLGKILMKVRKELS